MNTRALVYMWCAVLLFTAARVSAQDIGLAGIDATPGGGAVNAPDTKTPPPLPYQAQNELEWELDPYYSNLSLSIPFSDEPIPEISGRNEFEIYRKLFKNAFTPRFMLLEAAVFPMPLLGVGAKKYTPEFYRAFNVGSGDLNLLGVVTAGFQEPYAFSVFFGDLARFIKPGEETVNSNKGYMGYLFSYSNQHIKRNVLIPDNSLESEWKLKGDRIFKKDKLSWSFRVGAKIHQNQDIANTAYVGFRRSNLDFSADALSLFDNSSIDFRWDFSMKNGIPLRQEYTVGKKIPVPGWHVALKIDVGLIWENPEIYSGRLHETSHQNVVAVIRPNIEF